MNGLKLVLIISVELLLLNKPSKLFRSIFIDYWLIKSIESFRICQDIFLKLYNNGWLEEQNKEQLYCEKDQRFLADRYVEGICPKCNYPVSISLFQFLIATEKYEMAGSKRRSM